MVEAALEARERSAAAEAAPLRRRLKEALLRGILAGHYAAGERLVELRLAAEFATSQGPVREALRELEATGLVTNLPRRGTYVCAVVGEGLREIYAVRGALEEEATRRVTARRCCDLDRLGAEVANMRTAAAGGDVPALIEHSVSFHREIMRAAGNRLLLNIWSSLQIETRTTITMLADGLDLGEIAESHQPIVDAIASGDAERAGRVAREHQAYFENLPTPLVEPSLSGA